MLKKLIKGMWLAVLLAGCVPTAPDAEDCAEFDRQTLRAGRPTVCRMVWCVPRAVGNNYRTSGLAALWCDPAAPAAVPGGGK